MPATAGWPESGPEVRSAADEQAREILLKIRNPIRFDQHILEAIMFIIFKDGIVHIAA